MCTHFDVASRDIKGQLEISLPELNVKVIQDVTLCPDDNSVTVVLEAEHVSGRGSFSFLSCGILSKGRIRRGFSEYQI